MPVVSESCQEIPQGWIEDKDYISHTLAAQKFGVSKSAFYKVLRDHAEIKTKYANYRAKYHGYRCAVISLEGLVVLMNTKNVNAKENPKSSFEKKQLMVEKTIEMSKTPGMLYAIVEKMATQLSILTDEIAGLKGKLPGSMALPMPTVELQPITKRKAINALVRDFAVKHDLIYSELFYELYKDFYYRFSYDVQARWVKGKSLYENKLEMIESDGMIEELYALACDKFK